MKVDTSYSNPIIKAAYDQAVDVEVNRRTKDPEAAKELATALKTEAGYKAITEEFEPGYGDRILWEEDKLTEHPKMARFMYFIHGGGSPIAKFLMSNDENKLRQFVAKLPIDYSMLESFKHLDKAEVNKIIAGLRSSI